MKYIVRIVNLRIGSKHQFLCRCLIEPYPLGYLGTGLREVAFLSRHSSKMAQILDEPHKTTCTSEIKMMIEDFWVSARSNRETSSFRISFSKIAKNLFLWCFSFALCSNDHFCRWTHHNNSVCLRVRAI